MSFMNQHKSQWPAKSQKICRHFLWQIYKMLCTGQIYQKCTYPVHHSSNCPSPTAIFVDVTPVSIYIVNDIPGWNHSLHFKIRIVYIFEHQAWCTVVLSFCGITATHIQNIYIWNNMGPIVSKSHFEAHAHACFCLFDSGNTVLYLFFSKHTKEMSKNVLLVWAMGRDV